MAAADPEQIAGWLGVAVVSALSWLSSRRAARSAEATRQPAELTAQALGRLEGEMRGVAEGVRECQAGLKDLTLGQARLESRVERVEARAHEEPTRPDLPRPRQRMPSYGGGSR